MHIATPAAGMSGPVAPAASQAGRVHATQALFAALGEPALPAWADFARSVQVNRVAAGAPVFAQGVADARIHVLRSGLVKLHYFGEQGQEWIKSFLAEGDFFASLSAWEPNGRTSFAATAMDDCEMESFESAALRSLADRHLPWARVMHRALLQFARSKEQRERELLTLRAADRYALLCERSPGLVTRVRQKDLAQYLGVTPVGLSRIANRLRTQGGGEVAGADWRVADASNVRPPPQD